MREPTPEEVLADLFTETEEPDSYNYPPQPGDIPFTGSEE